MRKETEDNAREEGQNDIDGEGQASGEDGSSELTHAIEDI